jgi:hypothetical protein
VIVAGLATGSPLACQPNEDQCCQFSTSLET